MDEQTTNELMMHFIEVDEYTTIQLSIPKRLSAADLKGLMMKANKIFNISDMQEMQQVKGYKEGRTRGERVFWTKEMDTYIVENIGKMQIREMIPHLKNSSPSITEAAIYGRNKRLREKGLAPASTRTSGKRRQGKSVTWSAEMLAYFTANFKTKDVQEMLPEMQKMEPRLKKRHLEYRKYYELSKEAKR